MTCLRSLLFSLSFFAITCSAAGSVNPQDPKAKTASEVLYVSQRGNLPVVFYWADWCSACKKEYDRLSSLEYITLIPINATDLHPYGGAPGHNLGGFKIKSQDEALLKITGYPTIVVFDLTGKLDSVHVGKLDIQLIKTLFARCLDNPTKC